MTRWICLLRGVNVLGSSTLPMKELAALFTRLGLKKVETYIQSGNVVFSSPARSAGPLAAKIRRAILDAQGIDPHVIVITQDELEAAARHNPFPKAVREPKTLHLFFLDAEPQDPDIGKLELRRAKRERFALIEKVFYLHTPDGFAESKVRGAIERALGVPATARNWRTVTKLIELAEGG
ncbi:MAG TPA: DUF1697 domain-containing protein [Parvularculaceae bacterium]|nr:DUF1697 domain-containing protein [Parvularculaceae bacterium]